MRAPRIEDLDGARSLPRYRDRLRDWLGARDANKHGDEQG